MTMNLTQRAHKHIKHNNSGGWPRWRDGGALAPRAAQERGWPRLGVRRDAGPGKRDSIHDHLLEVIFETATELELRQNPLGGGGGGGGGGGV